MDSTTICNKINRCDICMKSTPKTEFKFKTIQLAMIDQRLHHILIKACKYCASQDFQLSAHLNTKLQKNLDKYRELGREIKIIYRPSIMPDIDNIVSQ